MTSSASRPTSDLVRTLAESLTSLFHQEVRQGREEMLEKLRQATPGALLLGGAAALAVSASAGAGVALVRAFDTFLPRPLAATAASASAGTAAVALAVAGVDALRKIEPLPERTIGSLREDMSVVAHPEPS